MPRRGVVGEQTGEEARQRLLWFESSMALLCNVVRSVPTEPFRA